MASLAARLAWRQQQQALALVTVQQPQQQQLLPFLRSSTLRSSTSRRPNQQFHQQQRRYESSGNTGSNNHGNSRQGQQQQGNNGTNQAAGGSSYSSSASTAAANATREARRRATAERIANRSMRFMPGFIASRLRGPLENMIKSPGSHVVSFLIIHEITAILPLFGFMALFVYMDWVPTAWVAGPWAAWALEGVRKYAGYFRKKGWFGMGGAADKHGEKKLEGELEEEVQHQNENKNSNKGARRWFPFGKNRGQQAADDGTSSTAIEAHQEEEAAKSGSTATKVATKAWHTVKKVVTFDNIDTGYKTSIQFAAAYAITKMLLPARLALSIWLTPSGARVFTRIWGVVRGGASAAK